MKKLFVLIIGLSLLAGGLGFASDSQALTNILPLEEENYDPVMQENILTPLVNPKNSLSTFFWKSNKRSNFLSVVNSIIGSVAILWLVILGIKFIFAQGDEEKLSNYKTQFGWTIAGLLTIVVGEYLAFEVLDPTTDILKGTPVTVKNLTTKVGHIVLFLEILVGGVMLASIMMSGYNLITGSEEDERIEQEKNIFQQFFIGTALILLAEVMVRIFGGQEAPKKEGEIGEYLDSPGELASQGVTEIVGIINFSLTFVGVAALIMLILSSLYYVLSFGNEDQMNRAKRIIITCIIGIIVIISSYTFIRFFIV
jgi:hypothetical protein